MLLATLSVALRSCDLLFGAVRRANYPARVRGATSRAAARGAQPLPLMGEACVARAQALHWTPCKRQAQRACFLVSSEHIKQFELFETIFGKRSKPNGPKPPCRGFGSRERARRSRCGHTHLTRHPRIITFTRTLPFRLGTFGDGAIFDHFIDLGFRSGLILFRIYRFVTGGTR